MTTKRIELKQCSVVFNQENHSYYLPEKGKFLSGITGMLERQLFPDTYAGVPEPVLQQAAEYGKSVHRSIEDFDANWINDGTQEVSDYISLCSENGLTHEASEYLITDGENYASMIDKVYRVDETTFDIGDIKTYGTITPDKREKARWQLSVYAYLFELTNKKTKVRRIFILHIRNKPRKDGAMDRASSFIELKRIPSEIVKDLLLSDSIGEQFANPYDIPYDIRQQETLIRSLVQAKSEAETKLNSVKARILSLMEVQDIKCWTTDTMRITRKLPATRKTFSLADFKEAYPDIDLEPYMKASAVAGNLTITL